MASARIGGVARMTTDDEFPAHMNAADAVMWDIERDPVLRSTITAVALLDRAPDWDRLVARLERGVREIPRLRQRVVEPPLRLGPPRWVDDPDVDLDYHLRHVRVPSGGGLREVLDLAQPISMDSFDRARPLWEFTVVEGLDDGRAALIQKVHHSLTDGVGGIRLALLLLDDERDVPIDDPDEVPLVAAPPSTLALAGDAVAGAGGGIARVAARTPGAAASAAGRALRDPLGTARAIGGFAGSLWCSLRPVTTPASPLMVRRSVGRRFETLEMPLADLLAAAHAAGGTLNDAFLAGVVGGLARYHLRHDVPLDRLRITMPIDHRAEDDPLGGNKFAPARFDVPADITDAKARMRRMGRITRSWRDEPALKASEQVAGALELLPAGITTGVMAGMLKAIDAVATNVPGIDRRVYLAGAEITDLYAFAPPVGAAMAIALLSHVDDACIGLAIDTAAVPDPDALRACVIEAFDEVLAVTDDGSSSRAER